MTRNAIFLNKDHVYKSYEDQNREYWTSIARMGGEW